MSIIKITTISVFLLIFLLFYEYILYFIFLIYPHEERSSEVKKIFYINLEESKDRKKRFLENYNKTRLRDLKPERFNGIHFKGKLKTKLNRGQYGCALSHILLLEKISKLEEGWYIVCEDDAMGDFSKIEKKIEYSLEINPYTNIINFNSYKSLISLGFSTRTTCYAVTPSAAKLASQIMKEKIENYPCDIAISYDRRLFFQSYNYKKFFYPDNVPSVINNISLGDN